MYPEETSWMKDSAVFKTQSELCHKYFSQMTTGWSWEFSGPESGLNKPHPKIPVS